MKILLIEDERSIAGMYEAKLTQEGFTVRLAYDGESGLASAQEERPDLIFLDIIMPKMNGLDVLKSLKDDPKTKSIPVYLLTNIPEELNKAKAAELGAAGYLFKAETEPRALAQLVHSLEADSASADSAASEDKAA